MQLEVYPMKLRPPEIRPGQVQRDWMDNFPERHAYKCLPLTMANCTGWEILCPMGFSAEWNGGQLQTDITITPERPHPDFHEFVESHFSDGVITMHTGYMFRSPPGWAVWATGSPNYFKDGIQALTGLVETDWLPFPFTMNWRFTRPGRITFKKNEPFCFFTLLEHRKLDAMEPVLKHMDADPVLAGQFQAWTVQRDTFNKKLARQDPEAMKSAWQRFYFKGEFPDDTGDPVSDHANRRRLKPVRII